MPHLDMPLTEQEAEKFEQLKEVFNVATRSEVVRKLIKMQLVLKEK